MRIRILGLVVIVDERNAQLVLAGGKVRFGFISRRIFTLRGNVDHAQLFSIDAQFHFGRLVAGLADDVAEMLTTGSLPGFDLRGHGGHGRSATQRKPMTLLTVSRPAVPPNSGQREQPQR